MTIIEIRPFRNGWQAYESAGVQPVFLNQEDAISYAQGRASLSLRRDSASRFKWQRDRVISFSEADRKL